MQSDNERGGKRPTGWYWVRIGNKAMEPAHYHSSGIWSRVRSIMNHHDGDFSEIGDAVK